MIEPLQLICPDDDQIGKHVTLRNFPFAPEKGDRIWIAGVQFEVTGREFRTENGLIDARGGVAVVLKRV